MKQRADFNNKNHETAQDRLAALIKEAGAEARARKQEALACHFRKLQAIINEAVSKQKGTV